MTDGTKGAAVTLASQDLRYLFDFRLTEVRLPLWLLTDRTQGDAMTLDSQNLENHFGYGLTGLRVPL